MHLTTLAMLSGHSGRSRPFSFALYLFVEPHLWAPGTQWGIKHPGPALMDLIFEWRDGPQSWIQDVGWTLLFFTLETGSST